MGDDGADGDQMDGMPSMGPRGGMSRDMMERIEMPINTVVNTMIVGMINCCRGLPPEVVFTAIAWHTGNGLANSVQGPLTEVINARKAFKEAFEDGVKQAKISQAPMPHPPPMSRG